MQELLIKEQTQLGVLVLNKNNLEELDNLIKTGPDDRDDLFHKPRIKSEKLGKLFNKIPIDWDEKDFDKVEKFIKQYGKNANYFQKFKDYVIINKTVEPYDFNGSWICDGLLLTLNLTGSSNWIDGEDIAKGKKCIAISGYKDVYDLDKIIWNEKEGKATIEFKFSKGLSGLLSKSNVWTLSLKGWKKETLIVKKETETLFYKKKSNCLSTTKTINWIIPESIEKMEKEFLNSTINKVVKVVDGTGVIGGVIPKEMIGLSIKELLIYIYNMHEFDLIQMQNINNQNIAILQFEKGFKTVNLVFDYNEKTSIDANKTNSCTIVIVGSTHKAIDDFIRLYDSGMININF